MKEKITQIIERSKLSFIMCIITLILSYIFIDSSLIFDGKEKITVLLIGFVPVIVFIASYGLYKMLYFLYIKMQLKMCCVWFLCVGMIVFVVNTNIAYLSSDIRCQQTFSFFNEIKKKYTEGDFVCI